MPYTILSIDDDESARVLFQIMLTRSGFNVVQAIDADDALEKLEDLIPDLILSDIQLPGMNGLQLVSLLRERPELDKTSIAILSAFQSDVMIQEANEAGADEFYKKPLVMSDLKEQLTNLIEKKQAN